MKKIKRPVMSFYGSKFRAAPKYPAPQHDTIIEPFAGAAGFSLRHYDRDVILVEKDPVIAMVWDFLINGSPADILSLPLITPDDDLREMDLQPHERSLIGFWVNKGSQAPCNILSSWGRKLYGTGSKQFWCEATRAHVAEVSGLIGHWRIICGDYSEAPNIQTHWFIDPPYVDKGRRYTCSSEDIDFSYLATWCSSRLGTVIVCEQAGADWLDFRPFHRSKSTTGSSSEVIWTNQPTDRRGR